MNVSSEKDSNMGFGKQWVSWLTQRWVSPALAAMREVFHQDTGIRDSLIRSGRQLGKTETTKEQIKGLFEGSINREQRRTKVRLRATSKGYAHDHNKAGSKLAQKVVKGTLGLPHGV